jgi:hypothetical protein
VCYSLHVEKNARSLSHTFSEDSGTLVLEIELALRDWLGRNNMSGQVLLKSIAIPNLDIRSMQTLHMISFGRHLDKVNVAFQTTTGERDRREKGERGKE